MDKRERERILTVRYSEERHPINRTIPWMVKYELECIINSDKNGRTFELLNKVWRFPVDR